MSDLDAPAALHKALEEIFRRHLHQSADTRDLIRCFDELADWARGQGSKGFWFAVRVDVARRILEACAARERDLNDTIRDLQDDLVSAYPNTSGRFARLPEDDD